MSNLTLVPSAVPVTRMRHEPGGTETITEMWAGFVSPAIPGLAITCAVAAFTGNANPDAWCVTHIASGAYVGSPRTSWKRATALLAALGATPINWTLPRSQLALSAPDINTAVKRATDDVEVTILVDGKEQP